MTELVERPLFYEGQVLAAADLTASLEYARAQAARDRRYLHTLGIATGLALKKRERETAAGVKYQEVTLQPGVAIDRTGLQVVVAEEIRVDEREFDSSGKRVNDPAAWYPVFLRGIEEAVPQPPLSLGPCATAQETRTGESATIEFGRPVEATDYDQGDPIDVSQGPGGSRDVPGSRVLLGFVQWDAAIQRFKDAADQADGVRRRYVGVQADEVIARGGSLTLRSAARTTPNKTAIVIDDANGGELRFGLTNAQGDIAPVLTVSAQGDLTVDGTVQMKKKQAKAAVLIESGVITDGLLVPLPDGVTEDAVTSGQVKLHVHVSPRYQGPDPSRGPTYFMIPVECRVDADRRIICRVRWVNLTVGAGSDVPGVCDYTIVSYAALA
jgi:hypothetical protein